MKKSMRFVIIAAFLLILSGCNGGDDNESSKGTVNDGEQTSKFGSLDHGVKDNASIENKTNEGDKTIGFSLNGGTIEEAADVPKEEKQLLIQAFNEYINTLNNADIDAYLNTLSSKGYNLEEERKATEEILAGHELTRDPQDFTIVDFSPKEAQIFTKMATKVKDKKSGAEESNNGRQVTVMVKENDKWKVSAVHYIGEAEAEK